MKIEDQIEGLWDTVTPEQESETRAFRTPRERVGAVIALGDLEILVNRIEIINWD